MLKNSVRLFCTAKQVYIRQALPSNVYIVHCTLYVYIIYCFIVIYVYVLQSLVNIGNIIQPENCKLYR